MSIVNGLRSVVFFVWMVVLVVPWAIVSLLVVPLLIAATAWFRRGAREGFREVRAKIARLNASHNNFMLALIGVLLLLMLVGIVEDFARGSPIGQTASAPQAAAAGLS